MYYISKLSFERLHLFILDMAERERNQHGLKRRKRSCASSLRSIVILGVCFVCLHIFSVCCLISNKMQLNTIYFVLVYFIDYFID